MKTAAALLLGIMIGVSASAQASPAFQVDWLVAQLQSMFHMRQGGIIPANPSYPFAPRLQYLGTTIDGDVYAVYLRHVY